MPFVTEMLDRGARLVLTGDVTIAEAASLHGALTGLVRVAGEVVVDDSRVATFDVTLLQLLVAFGRARRSAGASVRAVGGPPSARLAEFGLGTELSA